MHNVSVLIKKFNDAFCVLGIWVDTLVITLYDKVNPVSARTHVCKDDHSTTTTKIKVCKWHILFIHKIHEVIGDNT
jgi:hypothetical protein